MKNFYLLLVLFVFMAVTAVAQGDFRKEANSRRAQVDAAMQKMQPLEEDRIAEYKDRMESAKTKGNQTSPAVLFASYGSTHTSLTVHAFNAKELPDGTVMSASRIIDGHYHQLGWTTFSGNMPAGIFRYPLEDGKRSPWTEFSGVIVYEVYTFFPDGTTSYSSLAKPNNKYWAGMFTTQKLITGGTARIIGNQPIAILQGPITSAGAGAISVMVKDPDVDYDQRVVPFTIVGNNLRINLLASGIEVLPNSEIMVMVGTVDGRTDQYTVRVQ